MENTKKDIRALTKEELIQFFESHHMPSFRGKQVYQWLWQKGVHDFDSMTNLTLAHRELLKSHFDINHIKIDVEQKSKDGTVVFLVQSFQLMYKISHGSQKKLQFDSPFGLEQ